MTDGRKPGDFFSRYPGSAWIQIVVELFYLVALLGVSLVVLFVIGYDVSSSPARNSGFIASYFELSRDRALLIWISLALAGAVGGATFALKWLYHSVAKFSWNRDRWVWRFTVPLISSVLSLFSAFMITSGIVPFLSKTAFDNFYVALGFGFFAGYFSDNLLAALQRTAKRTFGTVDDPPGNPDKDETQDR